MWPTAVFVEEARAGQRGADDLKAARDYARMLFAGADEGAPDKQGRIAHPADAARVRRAQQATWS